MDGQTWLCFARLLRREASLSSVKRLIAVGFLLSAAGVIAEPASPFSKFVPPGYELNTFQKGELNGDSFEDAVLILDPRLPEDDRLVVILEGTKTGFRMAAKAAGVSYCARCGGAFGDPFEDPDIARGVLSIHNYGGSAQRWGHTYSFRKMDGHYRLISYSLSTFRSAEECTDAGMNYDLLSGEVQLQRDSLKPGTSECVTQAQSIKAPARNLRIEDQASWQLQTMSSYEWFFYPKEK